jgi:hypothetical protein
MLHVGEILFHRSSFGSTLTVWGYPPNDPLDEYMIWLGHHLSQGWHGHGASYRKLRDILAKVEEYPRVIHDSRR